MLMKPLLINKLNKIFTCVYNICLRVMTFKLLENYSLTITFKLCGYLSQVTGLQHLHDTIPESIDFPE